MTKKNTAAHSDSKTNELYILNHCPPHTGLGTDNNFIIYCTAGTSPLQGIYYFKERAGPRYICIIALVQHVPCTGGGGTQGHCSAHYPCNNPPHPCR